MIEDGVDLGGKTGGDQIHVPFEMVGDLTNLVEVSNYVKLSSLSLQSLMDSRFDMNVASIRGTS